MSMTIDECAYEVEELEKCGELEFNDELSQDEIDRIDEMIDFYKKMPPHLF